MLSALILLGCREIAINSSLLKMTYNHQFTSELIFGFEPTVYNVSENAGSEDLGIFLITGNAGEFMPHVNVSTVDETATSKPCNSNDDDDQQYTFTMA